VPTQIEIALGALPVARQQLSREVERLEAEGKRIVEIRYPGHAAADLGIGAGEYRGHRATQYTEPYPGRTVTVSMRTSHAVESAAVNGAKANGATARSVKWARGLPRLWVVLSFFWIAGVLVLASSDQQLSSRQVFREPNAEETRKCIEAKPGNFLNEQWCMDRRKDRTFFNENVSFPELIFAARWYGMAAIGLPIAIFSLA